MWWPLDTFKRLGADVLGPHPESMDSGAGLRSWRGFNAVKGSAKFVPFKQENTSECVLFVQTLGAHSGLHVPRSTEWKPGPEVQGNLSLEYGTIVATFKDDAYPPDGGHVGVYLGQESSGFWLADQWGYRANYQNTGNKRSAAPIEIRFKKWGAKKYFVVGTEVGSGGSGGTSFRSS